MGMIPMKSILLAMAPLALCCNSSHAARSHGPYRVEASAFALHGITQAGTRPHGGIVSADPAFLPLGTRIHVTGAGEFSGIYLVADTGTKVVGRHIDIYVPSRILARRFGTKSVSVSVLKWGRGEVSRPADRGAAKTAPRAVKSPVEE
jgi:3D (Asp-Asp-Asp) domain-containing protein